MKKYFNEISIDANYSISMDGVVKNRWSLSDEGRASLSKAHKNKIIPLETRQKMSIAAKNRRKIKQDKV